MKIFMTGATGFIGRHALAELSGEGHIVYALVRSLERFKEAMIPLGLHGHPRIVPIIGDLSQPRLGMADDDYWAVREADAIIHAGGPMNIELGFEEAERAFLRPAEEMARLAQEIHASHGLRQFIHVVGFMSPYDERNAMLDLDASLAKSPPYERMKFRADSYIRKSLAPLGIPLSTVNPSVVIGNSRTGVTEQLGGLSILVDAVRRNLMPLVPGGKGYWLPMVHIDHVARFIAALVGETKPVNETYYLLDRKADSPSLRELIRRIAQGLQAAPPRGTVPLRLLKSVLDLGAGRLLGIPGESMNFLVNSDFTVDTKESVDRRHGLHTAVVPETLPYVIADLDYRLSHPGIEPPARFAASRRSSLATLEREGGGTPVVFLHGTFSGASPFVPIAEHIEDRQVWLVDLPGFGRTPYHGNESVVEGYVEAVVGMVVEYGGPVALVGHSFGGLIAAKAAERLGDAVEKLLLLQPVLHPASALYKLAGATKAMLAFMSQAALRKDMVRSRHFVAGGEPLERYARFVHEELRSPRIRSANANVMAALTDSAATQLRTGSLQAAKTSILWGNLDRAYRIPEPFGGIDTTFIPYGHQFPIENPALTADWIGGKLRAAKTLPPMADAR